MRITRQSPLTGKWNTLEIPVTQEQLDRFADGRTLLQVCFPDLAPPLREFIKTGYTPEDWNALFGEGVSESNTRAWKAQQIDKEP